MIGRESTRRAVEEKGKKREKKGGTTGPSEIGPGQ